MLGRSLENCVVFFLRILALLGRIKLLRVSFLDKPGGLLGGRAAILRCSFCLLLTSPFALAFPPSFRGFGCLLTAANPLFFFLLIACFGRRVR